MTRFCLPLSFLSASQVKLQIYELLSVPSRHDTHSNLNAFVHLASPSGMLPLFLDLLVHMGKIHPSFMTQLNRYLSSREAALKFSSESLAHPLQKQD